MVIGDDMRLVQDFSKLAIDRLGCDLLHPKLSSSFTKHDQLEFNRSPLHVKCIETLRLIIEIEMLAHADFFVGSHHSNIAWLVDLLRHAVYKKSRSTYVEATPTRPLSNRDWYARVRRVFPDRFPWEKEHVK